MWAAYSPKHNAIFIDSEGLLGVSKNEHRRTRLLLKVLAVSDVVLYRTRAERLHNDLFTFLGDASDAYWKYFSPELKVQVVMSACMYSVLTSASSYLSIMTTACASNPIVKLYESTILTTKKWIQVIRCCFYQPHLYTHSSHSPSRQRLTAVPWTRPSPPSGPVLSSSMRHCILSC